MSDYCIENDGARRAELAAIHRHNQEHQYADLHADLLKAADKLAELISEPVAVNKYKGWLIRRDAALTAYQKAKEKTNAL
jgi:hypothetical protein